MKTVYVVIRTGVYRNEIVGVFTSKETAVLKAKEALKKEPDFYHDMEIIGLPLDYFLPEQGKTRTHEERMNSFGGSLNFTDWNDRKYIIAHVSHNKESDKIHVTYTHHNK